MPEQQRKAQAKRAIEDKTIVPLEKKDTTKWA